MSPRRSNQSAWGVASESDFNPRLLIVIGLGFLILGGLLGWTVHGISGANASSETTNQSEKVISTSIEDLTKAEKTEAGALSAATTFVVCLPDFSLQPTATINESLKRIIAPSADPQLAPQISAALQEVHQSLLGTPGNERQLAAKIALSPLTHKVTMSAPDQAEIAIWYVTALVDMGTQYVESSWNTTNLKLAWSDHWRIVSVSNKSGPTPVLYAANAKTSEFSDVVKVFNGFKAYRSAIAP